MVNFKFAKFKDAPLNRDGETSEDDFLGTEGDLVGLDEDVEGETEVVHADAAAEVAQPAIGVLLEDVRGRDYWTAELHDNGTMARQLDASYNADRTQPGDEVTYVRYGIYLEDVDDDTDFTPQEPVYLGYDGGVTQDAPDAAGDVRQVLGVAVDSETFLLEVEAEYEIVE